MKVGVPQEVAPGERRVALVPETVSRLGEGVVAVIALLCQLATAVHVPVAHARTAGTAPASLEHCAHRAQREATFGVQPQGRSTQHAGQRVCNRQQRHGSHTPFVIPDADRSNDR